MLSECHVRYRGMTLLTHLTISNGSFAPILPALCKNSEKYTNNDNFVIGSEIIHIEHDVPSVTFFVPSVTGQCPVRYLDLYRNAMQGDIPFDSVLFLSFV